jgi:hypothetical protein
MVDERSSKSGVRPGANNSLPQKSTCCDMLHRLHAWMGSWAWPEKWKMDMRFGTSGMMSWKVRVSEGSCQRICIVFRFLGNTGVHMGEELHWTSEWLNFVMCQRNENHYQEKKKTIPTATTLGCVRNRMSYTMLSRFRCNITLN